MKNKVQKLLLLLLSLSLCAALSGCGDGSLSDRIGKPRAKELALADAGFPARWVIELKADFTHQDGEQVYDVSFINATTIYQYVIDGETGRILQRQTAPLFGDSE